MADNLNVNIVIRAIDKASAVIKGITKSSEGLKAAAARSKQLFQSAASVRHAAEGVSIVSRVARKAVMGPIQAAQEFEQAMANVRAKTKMTDEEFAALTAQARELGKGTTYTAVESANAMEYMAIAGYKANQIMSAVPTTLALAASAGTDLGRTSDILTDVMGAFGVKAEGAAEVADIMARTFTGSNTTLETLFETMKIAGPQFKMLGIDMETAFSLAGVIGSAGLKGTMAATGLRSLMRGLQGATGPARDMMKSLGIKTTTKEGNLRNVLDIMQQVMDKTQKFGTVKQANIIGKLFGLRGTAATAVLIQSLKSGDMQKMLNQMADRTITASKIAKDRLDTAAGATKRLESAAAELNIELGMNLLKTVRSLTESLTTVLTWLTNFAKEWPTVTKFLMYATAAIAAATTALAGLLFVTSSLLSAAALYAFAPVVWAGTKALIAFGAKGAVTAAAGLTKMAVAALPVAAPILAVGAAIAGLSLAIVELVKNWEALNLSEAWQGMKDMFASEGAWETFKQLTDVSGLVGDLFGGEENSPETVGEVSGIPALAGAGGAMTGLLRIQVEGPARVTDAKMTGGDLEVDTGAFGSEQ